MRPELDELELLSQLILRVPFVLRDVRLFRRNIVNAKVTAGGRTWRARAGIKGQADAYAIVRGGRIVEVETKAAKGAMRREQEAWRSWCLAWGVPHLVLKARDGETAVETVERWVEELRQIVEELS